jgi:hypothetical protein
MLKIKTPRRPVLLSDDEFDLLRSALHTYAQQMSALINVGYIKLTSKQVSELDDRRVRAEMFRGDLADRFHKAEVQ